MNSEPKPKAQIPAGKARSAVSAVWEAGRLSAEGTFMARPILAHLKDHNGR